MMSLFKVSCVAKSTSGEQNWIYLTTTILDEPNGNRNQTKQWT
jgi:hypothetical protein